ncbi:hypothetical protein OIO90_006575 [Microbotryomycetes sp. JL221]|nr:hypothetical protein OIO90_006575 [Microbotryomycetes sp. JL221]
MSHTQSSSTTATRSNSPSRDRHQRNDKTNARTSSTTRSFSPDRKPWPERSVWYQWMPFRGMYFDVRRRLPFYASDWTLGVIKPNNWERVVGATVRMYFLNLFPALAYILDMNERTNGNYGVNEGILASAIAALTFAILSCQPLTIVGVTGLINLFNYTTYDIIEPYGVDYLQFMAWTLIWSAIMHWFIAIFNICDYTRFITDMTSETFGFYVGVIYIQKGIELLVFEFDVSGAAGWFSVVIAMLFALVVYFLERTAKLSFGPFWFRKFLQDYAFTIGIIFFTGFVHMQALRFIKDSGIEFLPITKSFAPSTDRPWVIRFWELPVKWIFVAIPFGFLVTLLFYFDNNVSSVMAQNRSFPVKRPAGFHWDFFLLGCTTFVSGILGLPAPNGLVPQAPVHTEALCVTKMVPEDTELTEGGFLDEKLARFESGQTEDEARRREDETPKRMKVVRTRLVEQRVDHLVMGLLILGTMSRPLLVVLGLMSRAMFAGIFIVVGWGSVEGNAIVHNTLFLLRDPRLTPVDHPLLTISKKSIIKFLAIQWFFFAATIAVSENIAGISFPVIITILIPLRVYWVPRLFTPHELAVLDAPTANSDAVLVSLGGPLQPEHGHDKYYNGDAGRNEGMHAATRPRITTKRSTGRGDEEKGLRRRLSHSRQDQPSPQQQSQQSREVENGMSGLQNVMNADRA